MTTAEADVTSPDRSAVTGTPPRAAAGATSPPRTDAHLAPPPDARTAVSAGAWAHRPAGLPGAVPPPSVPLSFLVAAAAGLVAGGIAWVWVASTAATTPSADRVVAAVHLGVLATLSMGIIGAAHQFTPVVTGRPLRSLRLARATFVVWLAASWMLPLGVATEQLGVTATSGALAGVGVVLVALNLGKPLSVRGKGSPVTALRLALVGAVLTGFLGMAFVGDRQGNWFELSGHADVAMGVLGLFGWLGMTYVGVAEKLWPMFMLAHVPRRRHWGRVAVWGCGIGVALLVPGLGWGVTGLAIGGSAVLAAGLGAHLASLGLHVAHRRRKADLHLAFVVTAAAWLPIAAGLALAAAVLISHQRHVATALAAGAMAAVGSWLLVALVGHVHKVVPFIMWSVLRARAVTMGPTGKPLMFADLYDHRAASLAYACVTAGTVALCAGLAGSLPALIAAGGVLLSITGIVVAANLSAIPLRMLRMRCRAVPAVPGSPAP